MSLPRSIARKATKKLWVRLLNRIGRVLGKVVDTSADAPEAHFEPKRDVYREHQATTEPAADAS